MESLSPRTTSLGWIFGINPSSRLRDQGLRLHLYVSTAREDLARGLQILVGWTLGNLGSYDPYDPYDPYEIHMKFGKLSPFVLLWNPYDPFVVGEVPILVLGTKAMWMGCRSQTLATTRAGIGWIGGATGKLRGYPLVMTKKKLWKITISKGKLTINGDFQ